MNIDRILRRKYKAPPLEQERVQVLPFGVCGLLLPGWFCPNCRAFNGAAKEHLSTCRCCGAEAP